MALRELVEGQAASAGESATYALVRLVISSSLHLCRVISSAVLHMIMCDMSREA